MNQSGIVSELLHKLTKNELFAQNGGNNKANKYRNKLNSMYGSGEEESTKSRTIINHLDQMVPVSIVKAITNQLKDKISELTSEKERLSGEISTLNAKLVEDGSTSVAETTDLRAQLLVKETELDRIRNESTRITEELDKKAVELQEQLQEVESLKGLLDNINKKTTEVADFSSEDVMKMLGVTNYTTL